MADSEKPTNDVRRCEALAKLGLGVLVAYAAHTVVHLDRAANAQVRPSCNGKIQGQPLV